MLTSRGTRRSRWRAEGVQGASGMSTVERRETVAVDRSAIVRLPGRRRTQRRRLVVAVVVGLVTVAGGAAAVTRDRSAGQERASGRAGSRCGGGHHPQASCRRSACPRPTGLAGRHRSERDALPAGGTHCLRQPPAAGVRPRGATRWSDPSSAPPTSARYGAPFVLTPLLLHYAIQDFAVASRGADYRGHWR